MSTFSKELYEKYDHPAWLTVKNNLFLFEIGKYHLKENYEIDTELLFNGEVKFLLELEVLQKWIGADFPYPRISHLARKVFDYKNIPNSYYLQFNKPMTHVAITKFSDTYDMSNFEEFEATFENGNCIPDDRRFLNPKINTTFIPVDGLESYFMGRLDYYFNVV